MTLRHRRAARLTRGLLPLLVLLSTVDGTQQPHGNDEAQQLHVPPDAAEDLVRRYAPLLFLHPDERWLPDDVTSFLSRVHVMDTAGLRPAANSSLPTGVNSLQAHLVADLPPGLGTRHLSPPTHLRGTDPSSGQVPVYVWLHLCRPWEPGREPSFHATYWTFHPFSEGKLAAGRLRGSHVGDWEHVSLSVQDGEPVSIYLSAHEFGAFYSYSGATGLFHFSSVNNRGHLPVSPTYAPTLKMHGTHPVLYVARGSHGIWPDAGVHVYSRLPQLTDVTAAGRPWRTWHNLHLLHERRPRWLQYLGRWGNAADCWHLMQQLCTISAGPVGIPLRSTAFQCPQSTSSGRSRGSRWARMVLSWGR